MIEQARKRVATTVNIAEVYTKYNIGRYIVEYEQHGEYRAKYGKQVLKGLSEHLTQRFGAGWSYETLVTCKKFFIVYSNSANTVYRIQERNDNQCLSNSKTLIDKMLLPKQKVISDPAFTLSWSHYLVLMRIENADARSFYEVECAQQQWSVRQLSRQYLHKLKMIDSVYQFAI